MKWKPPVFFRLSSFLILLPILDFLGLWMFSQSMLGLLTTLVFIIVTALLGIFLARRQGLRCWIDMNRQMDRGEQPTLALLNGGLIFLGGLLLVVPGLLTDLCGLLLLFPPFRALVISHLSLQFEAWRLQSRHRPPSEPSDVIDID